MPTITTYPETDFPNTLNCLQICIQGTDYEFIESAGLNATFNLIIPSTVPIALDPDNPVTITIAGYVYELVSSPQGNGVGTVLADTDGAAFAQNIITAMQLTYGFNGATIFNDGDGALSVAWCDKGEVENFEFNFDSIAGEQLIAVNGSDFQLKDKRLLYQLFCVDENGGKDIAVCPPTNPAVQTKNCLIIPNCFQIQNDIDGLLSTRKPELSDGIQYDENIKKRFKIKHGTIEYVKTESLKQDIRYTIETEFTGIYGVNFEGQAILNEPYTTETATSDGVIDYTHPFAVDMKAWLLLQGYSVENVGLLSTDSLMTLVLECIVDFPYEDFQFFIGEFNSQPSLFSSEVIRTCGVETSNWVNGEEFDVINSRYLKGDSNKFEDYTRGKGKKFLTNIPSGSVICCDSCRWLWLCIGAIENNVYAELTTYDTNGNATINTIFIDLVDNQDVIILPVGTANIENWTSVDFSNTCKYSIQLFLGGQFPVEISENYEFNIDPTCCCDVEIIYKTDAGGYDTISFDCVDSITYESTQTEICLDVECGGTKYRQIEGKGKERFVLTTRGYQRTRAQREVFKQFKKSNSRCIKTKDLQGNWVLTPFILDPSGASIFQKDSKLEMVVSGYCDEDESTSEF